MLVQLFLVSLLLAPKSGLCLNYDVYIPEVGNLPNGLTGWAISSSSNVVDCSFRCSQFFQSSKGCTMFWINWGTWCYVAIYGSDSVLPAKRSANVTKYTFYARSDVTKLGQVVFVAGGELSGSSIKSAELYSPDGRCQYSVSNLPLPVLGLRIGMSLNAILACSGFDTSTNLKNLECWRFYPSSQSWSSKYVTLTAAIPKYPMGTYQDRFYFLNDGPSESYSNAVGPTTSAWSSIPLQPIGEGACSVNWADSMIVFGGSTAGKVVQRYNFNTKIWTVLAPMAVAHNFSACALLPGKKKVLIVSTMPGADETRADIYDTASNTWSQTGSTLYPRAGSSLVTLGTRVFVMGGNWSPSPITLSTTVEEYNVQLGTWSLAKSSMISGRKNFDVMPLPAALFPNLPQGCVGVQ